MKWNSFFFNLLPRLYSNIICKNIVKIFWKFEVGYTQTSTPLENTTMWHPKRSYYNVLSPFVVTLTLGSRPRQGLVRVQAKREAQESHLPGVQESVKEWTLTLPSQLPFWELESWWTPKSSKTDCTSQNPLDWRVLYIIKKFLKFKCLNWLAWLIWTLQT
jgi:hypothetical protein